MCWLKSGHPSCEALIGTGTGAWRGNRHLSASSTRCKCCNSWDINMGIILQGHLLFVDHLNEINYFTFP